MNELETDLQRAYKALTELENGVKTYRGLTYMRKGLYSYEMVRAISNGKRSSGDEKKLKKSLDTIENIVWQQS